MPSATRQDWGINPMPKERINFEWDKSWSKEAFTLLRQGFVPEQMEDHWFVFFENDTLYFCRSWTGDCIFQVTFQETEKEWVVISVIANRNQEQYLSDSIDLDKAELESLMERVIEVNAEAQSGACTYKDPEEELAYLFRNGGYTPPPAKMP